MARDRLAALRAQQQQPTANASPSHPQQSRGPPPVQRQQSRESQFSLDYYTEHEPAPAPLPPPVAPSQQRSGLPSGPRPTQQRRPTNPPPIPQTQPLRSPMEQPSLVNDRFQAGGGGYAQQQSSYRPPARRQSTAQSQNNYDRSAAPLGDVPSLAYRPNDALGSSQGSYASEKSEKRVYSSEESYEMKAPKKLAKKIKAGDVQFEEMGEFFVEISDLQQAIRYGNDQVAQAQALHLRLIAQASADDPAAISLQQTLTQTSMKMRTHFSSLKNRIRVLEQGNANLRALVPVGMSVHGLTMADVNTRKIQVDALKTRFKDVVQRYAEVERDARAKTRGRLERQVRIVNPDLAPQEIDRMVRDAETGGSTALFSQALMSGQRSNAARGAMREVESRAAELVRIEETLTELAQIFNDMAVLVEAQDIQIIEVEQTAMTANVDVEQGLVQTQKAVSSAKRARKMRWWCLGLLIVTLIVVALVVVFQVVLPILKKNAEGNDAAQSSVAAASGPAPTQNAIQSLSGSTSVTTQPTSVRPMATIPITATSYVAGSGNGGFLAVPTTTS